MHEDKVDRIEVLGRQNQQSMSELQAEGAHYGLTEIGGQRADFKPIHLQGRVEARLQALGCDTVSLANGVLESLRNAETGCCLLDRVADVVAKGAEEPAQLISTAQGLHVGGGNFSIWHTASSCLAPGDAQGTRGVWAHPE